MAPPDRCSRLRRIPRSEPSLPVRAAPSFPAGVHGGARSRTGFGRFDLWLQRVNRMSASLAVGDKAPDFTLPTDGASDLKLSSHLGKKVVVYFYRRMTPAAALRRRSPSMARRRPSRQPTRSSSESPRTARQATPNSARSMASNSRLPQTRKRKRWKRMACGSRRACTARNTWASSGRPS